jgi:hypothetical protein
MRYAMIHEETGVVANVIALDNPATWEVPTGYTLIESDGVGIGDTWNGKQFIKPAPELKEEEPTIEGLLSRISALEAGPSLKGGE